MSESVAHSSTIDAAGPTPVPTAGPVSHAIVRVARLHRMLASQLLRRVGLHPSQELVMMQFWDFGPQRQSDLARLLGADAATITRTIQRLEQGGFVKRSPSPTDKRVTVVEPTVASRTLRNVVEQAWQELERGVTHDLSPKERAAAVELLARMEHGLERTVADNRLTT